MSLFFIVFSVMVASCYVCLTRREKRHPDYSIRSVIQQAREQWVENVMRQPGLEVLAVQTLRNVTMASTFLASTTTRNLAPGLHRGDNPSWVP
ncbi:MAG: DUF599 family protein [Magnetococcales bacterium]|nr:DUF599 family protein [Magnetococcales bacterium]